MASSQFILSLHKEDDMDMVQLPKLLIKHFNVLGLKANELHLYSLIAYLESEGIPIPSQEKLAGMMGLSERQFKQIVADLKQKGLLLVNRTKKYNKKKYSFKPLLDKAWRIENDVEHSFLLLAEVGE